MSIRRIIGRPNLYLRVTVLVLAVAARSRAIDFVKPLELPDRAMGFAGSPQAGTVAILNGDGVLSLYPRLTSEGTLDGAIHEKSGASFTSVAYKRVPAKDGSAGYFVAIGRGSKGLQVFDERTLEPVKTVPLSGENPGRVTASRSDRDPYVVYASARPRQSPQPPQPHRVNLVTFVDEGAIDLAGDESDDLVLSSDGSKLYGRRSDTSPTGVRCWQIVPALPPRHGLAGTMLHTEHNSRSAYVPDATGQYVACGTALFTADMRQGVTDLPAPALLFSSDRPLIFGTNESGVTAMSLNSFRVLGKVALPVEDAKIVLGRPRPPAVPRPMPPGSGGPVLLEDPKNKTLLLCTPSRLFFIPESAFQLPDEPFLYAEVQGSTELPVDQPARLKLVKRDANATLRLVTAPDGMKLDGDTIVWTPASSDVGPVKVVVELSAANVQRSQEIDLVVRRPFVPLPFSPEELYVSSDGKLAMGIEYTQDFSPSTTGRAFNPVPYCHVVLVDLAAAQGRDGRPPAAPIDRVLAANISPRGAAVDEHFVFLPLQDSDAFLTLSRKDLADVQRTFTPARVTAMSVAGGSLYAAYANPYTGPTDAKQTYHLPDLKLVDAQKATNAYVSDARAPGILPWPVGDDWLFEDVLYDNAMNKAKFVFAARGFVVDRALRSGAPPYDPLQRPPTARWGVLLQGLAVQHIGGQELGQLRSPPIDPNDGSTAAVVLPDLPAVAVIEATKLQLGTPEAAREHATITFHDLVTAAKVGTITLLDEPAVHPAGAWNRERPSMVRGIPGAVVAVTGQQLFVVPTSGKGAAVDAATLPVPLHFVNEQSTIAFDAGKPVFLEHAARGGDAPLEFSLVSDAPGVEIDKATGRVTLDPHMLAPGAVEVLYQAIQTEYRNQAAVAANTAGLPRSPETVTFEAALEDYLKSVTPRFTRLAGRTPRGVPTAIPLSLVVHDKNQQAATRSEVVLFDVPRELLLAKEREVERKRQGAAAAARKAADPVRPSGTPQAPAPDVATLNQRIADLERENAQLRAKVEVLSDLMRGGAGKPPTSQPR